MPTISLFYGITIRMYFNDHPPPQFLAEYQGNEANVSIDTARRSLASCQRPPRGW